MLALLTVHVGTDPVPLLGRLNAVGAGLVVVNVGGLDIAGDLPGPDDAYLFANNGDASPAVFVLLSGAGLSMPGDISNLYGAAVSGTTTLTVALGTRP